MSNDETRTMWDEPLFLPQTYVHPRTGQYRDKPEAWWAGRKVRLYVDVDVQGQPLRYPLWLDFVRFEDQMVDGSPMRMGLGRTQVAMAGDQRVPEGTSLSFHPGEVFDVTEPAVAHEGIYVPVASVA